MSTKGTAAKSANGAAMSKYDVEVEARLQSLEKKSNTGGDDRIAVLEKKYTALLEELKGARLPLDFNDLSL
tara:strand:+ start:805 stop:1017 length:213 start_codon:yes stop_codon:yes gene_type:complete